MFCTAVSTQTVLDWRPQRFLSSDRLRLFFQSWKKCCLSPLVAFCVKAKKFGELWGRKRKSGGVLIQRLNEHTWDRKVLRAFRVHVASLSARLSRKDVACTQSCGDAHSYNLISASDTHTHMHTHMHTHPLPM